MKTETIKALATMAESVAAYETAWRDDIKRDLSKPLGHPDNVEYAARDEKMREAFHASHLAREIVEDELGREVATAIYAALVQASARVKNERRHEPGDAEKFISGEVMWSTMDESDE